MTQANELRIIIIDDNPAIHQDFIKILTPKNSIGKPVALDDVIFGNTNTESKPLLPKFQIDTASQGQEGVDQIRKAYERGEPYALAFVDVRMPPGLDGIETIKEIWKISPDIQTVICTAFSDYSKEELELAKLLMNKLYKKKFDISRFKDTFAARLAKAIKLKQEGKVVKVKHPTPVGAPEASLLEALRASVRHYDKKPPSTRLH